MWVWVLLQSLKLQILRLFWVRSSLTFRKRYIVDSLWNAYVTWYWCKVKCTIEVRTHDKAHSFGPFCKMVDCFLQANSCGYESRCSNLNFITLFSNEEFLDIKTNMECGFSLKSIGDMIKIYGQIDCRDKYPQHGTIIWPIWPNSLVFK